MKVQVFRSDMSLFHQYIEGDYCYHLSSEDSFDPEIPLLKRRAKGGSMVLWDRSIDPFVAPLQTPSPAICGIVISMPNTIVSAHFAIYLPTSGLDDEFVEEISNLEVCLEETLEKYPGIQVFIRGDSNCNKNNAPRVMLFEDLLKKFKLKQISIPHLTYHHFTGDGCSDSGIDVVVGPSDGVFGSETIDDIICVLDNPSLGSHNDIIQSSLSFNFQQKRKCLSLQR